MQLQAYDPPHQPREFPFPSRISRLRLAAMLRPSPRTAAALLAALAALPISARAQSSAPALAVTSPVPTPAAGSTVDPAAGFTPTWETQKQARTYLLGIPAPRGQIVDRNGEPFAQTRMSSNLAIKFPTPLTFSEAQLVAFVQKQLTTARAITGRSISLSTETVVKHYKNRGVLPLVIASDLRADELAAFKQQQPQNLMVQSSYLRFYPQGALAGHIVGYAGRAGKMPDGPIENNEFLWPGAEGREGLEQTFDASLQGKPGQYNMSFDATGKLATEQVSIPPQPGNNVVTTLDMNLQRLCEKTMREGSKRGAMVFMDPNNGDILAMVSWPSYDPNLFVPAISQENFKRLQDDPDVPLLPRAFRSAYPPASTYKIIVGLAAMQTGKIQPADEFSCPPSMEIGNLTFRNWKKTGSGMLNFTEALAQSCDTWFYQVGIKIGPQPVIDYSTQLGLGRKTGLPLTAEAEGTVPTDEYMLKVHKRKILNGDVANMSIGQGDLLVTPLQMAQTMATLANGGTLYQTRLVQQVQAIDGGIVNAYNIRARSQVEIDRAVLNNLRRGMEMVVTDATGTAHQAEVPNVVVAGKTGTGQWGPKNKERTAAWFAGFAPARKPKYAFAVVYEGDANDDEVHGGSSAAPLIGKVLREVFKDEKAPQKKKKKRGADEEATETPADPNAAPEDNIDYEAGLPGHGGRRSNESEAAPEDAPVFEPAPTPPPRQRNDRPQNFWRRLFGGSKG